MEVDGTIPYLDMLLIRQPDGTVKIDWYQKPTACNRTLNSHSQHPLKRKSAVAYGMFHRILSLVDDEFRKKNHHSHRRNFTREFIPIESHYETAKEIRCNAKYDR